jgi:hypothetical protein
MSDFGQPPPRRGAQRVSGASWRFDPNRRNADPSPRAAVMSAMAAAVHAHECMAMPNCDGDGNGPRKAPADVIGSVANYFAAFNWQPGMLTHYPVRLRRRCPTDMNTLMAPDIPLHLQRSASRCCRLQGDCSTPARWPDELLNGLTRPSTSAPRTLPSPATTGELLRQYGDRAGQEVTGMKR